MTRVFYLIPDLYRRVPFSFKKLFRNIQQKKAKQYLRRCLFQIHKPTGGVKVIYQHCKLLREMGVDAKPLLMGKYHGNFFDFDIPTVRYKEIKDDIGVNDIIVATEFKPYQGKLFKEAKKILFLQNWIGVTRWLHPEDHNKSYLDIGYDKVVTCSQYCSDYVSEKMNIPTSTITNGIDLTLFRPSKEKRINNRILAMSRKNPQDLSIIQQIMKEKGFEIRVVDGLTQAELIEEYQAADIFIATGYPEGFSLPPLEAMACGAVVVGFTGGAAAEYMIDEETALVCSDGDARGLTEKLIGLLTDTRRKELLRAGGLSKAQDYGMAKMQEQLKAFYADIIKH